MGGDSSGRSGDLRSRDRDLGSPDLRPAKVPYAELHCHSNFSFLDGASHPEELVTEAVRLGLDALAITDHDGLYGVVRFAEAAREVGLPTVFGAELSLGLTRRQSGVADPEGSHLVVLARDPEGYTRLCRALSVAQLAGRAKGRPSIDLPTLAAIGAGLVPDVAAVARDGSVRLQEQDLPEPAHLPEPTPRREPARLREPVHGSGGRAADHWMVLTGCRKGTVPGALIDAGPARARAELARLQDHFGRDNVLVELWDHGEPLDSVRNDALVSLAVDAGAELVATNNVHYHVPARHRLAGALAAVRARSSLDAMVGWLPPASAAHLRSGREMAGRFGRYPGVVERAAEIGRECAFDLNLVAPSLPPYPTPDGVSEMAFLRRLVTERAVRRYGTREAPTRQGAWDRIDHELEVIEDLGFPGYFLIVWDIVEFCHRQDILCQGRGSAANSAVCYVLGITKADAVELGLLFERFLSAARKDEAPDIDVDIESGRREEVIQYVYGRYGRGCASLVANVITYRPRSAVRDMGKALGASTGQLDAWAKQIEAWGPLTPEGSLPVASRKKSGPWSHDGDAIAARASGPGTQEAGSQEAGRRGGGGAAEHDIPAPVTDLAAQVLHFPRHLGIHPGGMVLCDRPVSEVCPVEWATMADRSILQWDKDDCASAGLVKFDLLGLGMLSALHATIDHIDRFYGEEIDLATIPQEAAVYEMLSRADSIGVFQVESRAQMATLPRLAPKGFYDLVIEVALIRPGPIQGGSVHPYLRRRKGVEPATPLHPKVETTLEKTLGVPLFQEQLMQMAIDVAGFSPAESDQLRQAMGSKRSHDRIEKLKVRLYEGMAGNGITGEAADHIYEKLQAFANFGFPESHAVSFAYLVYASAWLKLHYPAAFCAGLLDSQPMGFWSPQTLVSDARRHGVRVLGPDVNASDAKSRLDKWDGEGVVRLGLSYVRHVGADLAERIAAERAERTVGGHAAGGPYRDIEDVVRRTGINAAQAEALATAGAFGCFGLSRRGALWAAGALAQAGGGLEEAGAGSASAVVPRSARLPGLVTGVEAPPLPDMNPTERNRADLWATGLSPDSYPTELIRAELDAAGVVVAADLMTVPVDRPVRVAGIVTHRQRPSTAKGVIFLNLEDETGLVNVICPPPVWAKYRRVARSEPALVVDGRLERVDGVVNVLAQRISPLPLESSTLRSRDFR